MNDIEFNNSKGETVMSMGLDGQINRAWRIVDDTHPITRAAIQVIIDDYESKLSRLRELHKPIGHECSHCSSLIRYGSDGTGRQFFPCPTIKALDGETK